MTTNERALDLRCQLLQANVNDLINTLAKAFEERDELKKQVADLQAPQPPKE